MLLIAKRAKKINRLRQKTGFSPGGKKSLSSCAVYVLLIPNIIRTTTNVKSASKGRFLLSFLVRKCTCEIIRFGGPNSLLLEPGGTLLALLAEGEFPEVFGSAELSGGYSMLPLAV